VGAQLLERVEVEVGARVERVVPHARLDRCLLRLASRPERFEAELERLVRALDARGLALELADPAGWRRSAGRARVTVARQFSDDIRCVRPMEREEELRLALRLELARLRVRRALERHPVEPAARAGSEPPAELFRRQAELHALRLELIERNLFLVLVNVGRFRHTSAERADLIQAASAALFRAVDGFDWRHGVLFRTYAVHWINDGIRNHLYDFSSTVRVPVYLQKNLKHVQAAIQRLGDPHASVEEIALESGLRGERVVSARAAMRRTRSLDAGGDDPDGGRSMLHDLALADDEGARDSRLEDTTIPMGIDLALARLTPRERRVVELRFGLGQGREHLYSEVARDVGVSVERVRQILLRAMTKMRTLELRKVLETFAT